LDSDRTRYPVQPVDDRGYLHRPSQRYFPRQVTVTATSVAKSADTAQLSFGVYPPPTVTTTSLPAASEYTAYTATLQATGGAGTLTWKVSSGSLPAWATLNGSAGVISGTPNSSVTTNFSVAVTDPTGVTSPSQALSLTVDPPPALKITTTSLPSGAAGTAYYAGLLATGGVAPYTWSITSGSLPAWASLNASTGAISGMPNAAGTTNFTVQVTDSESPTVSVTQPLSITIAPALALTISGASLPNGNVGIAYTATLAAAGGVTPYTWSISSGSLPSWAQLDSLTGVISGTPDAKGTTNFTVQVTDSSATPVSATQALSITINPAIGPNAGELKGNYAFLLQGFDDASGNQFAIAGGFVADGNGNITGGIADVNGPSPVTDLSLTGYYSLGADNRGTITLNGSDASSRTFAIAVGSLNSSNIATKATIIEFDDTNAAGDRGSGTVYLQDTAVFSVASVSGPYAFGLSGQQAAAGSRLAEIGAFTADGNGNITNGELDANSGGTAQNASFTASLSADANITTFGRLVMSVSGGATGLNVLYIIDATRLLMVSIDAETTAGLIAGEVRAQSSASYSASSLNGTSVIYTIGQNVVDVGSLTFTSSNTSIAASLDENKAGTASATTATFTYSVSSNGRTAVSGGKHPMLAYLAASNEGFFLDDDPAVSIGYFEPQSTGTFSNSSVSGNYFFGVTPPAVSASTVDSGVAASTGNGVLTSTEDASSLSGLTTGQSLTDTLTIGSNGRVTDSLGNILYIITSSKIVLINTTDTVPGVTIFQQ
jgi:hypothetical protein